MRFQVLLFNHDGTVVDSKSPHLALWHRAIYDGRCVIKGRNPGPSGLSQYSGVML